MKHSNFEWLNLMFAGVSQPQMVCFHCAMSTLGESLHSSERRKNAHCTGAHYTGLGYPRSNKTARVWQKKSQPQSTHTEHGRTCLTCVENESWRNLTNLGLGAVAADFTGSDPFHGT